jgi:hypothetical protein
MWATASRCSTRPPMAGRLVGQLAEALVKSWRSWASETMGKSSSAGGCISVGAMDFSPVPDLCLKGVRAAAGFRREARDGRHRKPRND